MTGRRLNHRGPRFSVGDVVEYELVGGRRKQGTIIEDRGPLGVGGRRVYRLSVKWDMDNTVEFELPEDLLTLRAQPQHTAQ